MTAQLLLPLPCASLTFLTLHQRWLVFQGQSPLKPILKETGCQLLRGLPNIGLLFILRPLQIHRKLQKQYREILCTLHPVSTVLPSYVTIVHYQNMQLILLQVCDTISSCDTIKITLIPPLILTHPVSLLCHTYTNTKLECRWGERKLSIPHCQLTQRWHSVNNLYSRVRLPKLENRLCSFLPVPT